ncbi:hypothetical protein KR222_000832, partial [Zaprionus bogoriensis]
RGCCRVPQINLTTYENGKCSKFPVDGIHSWPCSFECVFKAANALNGTTLVLQNVHTMNELVLYDGPQMIPVFNNAYDRCFDMEAEIVEIIKRRRSAAHAKCSPVAMMYGICAYKHVFLDCPAEHWTNSTYCNRMKACEQA